MNMNFTSQIRKISLFGTFFLLSVFGVVMAQTTTFPTTPPAGEVEGGYFHGYFKNIFKSGNVCPAGQAIIGFRYQSNTPFWNGDDTGTPVCADVATADGLASGFTGSMVGSAGYVPMYNATGTGLVNSIMLQENWGIVVKSRGTPNSAAFQVRQDDSSSLIAHFFRHYNGHSPSLSIYAYPRNMQGVSPYMSGVAMLYAGNNTASLDISSDNRAGAIRFLVGWWGSPSFEKMRITETGVGIGTTNPTQKLDVNGKVKITDGSQWIGKILTSDTNGVATWQNLPSPVSCLILGVNKNHTCFGKSALRRANNTFNDTAFGYIAGGHSLGNSNVFVGHAAFGNWYSASGNVVIGAEAANTFVDHLKDNVIIGYRAFERFEKGENNVMIGAHAWRNSTGYGYAKMNNSIIIGGGLTHYGNYNTTTNNYLNIGNWITGQDGNISIGSPSRITSTGAKLTVNGKIKITDGSQGSGKVLVSDDNGLARWETANFGGGSNPNDCSATEKVVNGHKYPVRALTNGNSFVSTMQEDIANGRRQWTQEFMCTQGSLGARGGEQSQIFCNNGYINNGAACVAPPSTTTTPTTGPANCTAMTYSHNNRHYSVAAMQHNFSSVSYATTAITNGVENYKQSFGCDNATISVIGQEEKISVTCNAGYTYNGSACVPGGTEVVNEAFSGTLCNTANIQIVDIAPGVDKIPENLSADTLYRLSAGQYDITKKINMNTCSAVIGAGTGATTVGYAGIASGAETLFHGQEKDNTVIMNLKIDGQTGVGKAKTGISIVGTNNRNVKTKIENVEVRNLTNVGINLEYVKNGLFKNIVVDEIRSTTDNAYGVNATSSSYNAFTDIIVDKISSSSSSPSSYTYAYGISISSFNNTLTNIIISNISSSSSSSSNRAYAYGISISSSNNTLTKITIGNISSSSSYAHAYGISISSSNNTLTKITIGNISSSSSSSFSSSYAHVYGISISSSNNTLTNIAISNISSSSSSSSSSHAHGISISSSNNTLTNIAISNISSSSSSSSSSHAHGISISSSNNTLTNIAISNISSSSSYNRAHAYGVSIASYSSEFRNILVSAIKNGVGMQVQWQKHNISNLLIAHVDQEAIKFEGASTKDNIVHNFTIYNNKGAGVTMTGSNNSLSQGWVYNNGGKAVDGGGTAHFYFNTLTMFGNAGGNTATPLHRGQASTWRTPIVLGDGRLVTTGTFSSPAWTVRPTNVPGFNPATRGYQAGLTWPDTVNWLFGSNIPSQVPPILTGNCFLSVSSTTPCKLEVGSTGTYNGTKKIWQF